MRKSDSRTMIAVLQILVEHPEGISQQSIAEQTGRTKQLVVMAIDKLEKKGFAVRNTHISDRRVNYICITNAGINHIKEFYPHTIETCELALSSLSGAELELMLPLIIKLTKGVWEKLGNKYYDKTYGQPDPDRY